MTIIWWCSRSLSVLQSLYPTFLTAVLDALGNESNCVDSLNEIGNGIKCFFIIILKMYKMGN